MTENIVEAAKIIAMEAHFGQYRKWGNQEPYIIHPEWVANKVKELGFGDIEQAAAALHDSYEDRAIPDGTMSYWSSRIIKECGQSVHMLVMQLTNPSHMPNWKLANPNPTRAEKWAVNKAHIEKAPDIVKMIKIVDRLHNCKSSLGVAPINWMRKYVPESWELARICGTAFPGNDKVQGLLWELLDIIGDMEDEVKEYDRTS